MTEAILAAIGGGALLAIGAKRSVVIGVGAWKRSRSVIVQVGQQGRVVKVAMMVPVPRMGRRRCRNHDGDCQKCGSAKQIHHCCAPKMLWQKNVTKPLFQTASLNGRGPSTIRRKAYIKYSPMCTIEHRRTGRGNYRLRSTTGGFH